MVKIQLETIGNKLTKKEDETSFRQELQKGGFWEFNEPRVKMGQPNGLTRFTQLITERRVTWF